MALILFIGKIYNSREALIRTVDAIRRKYEVGHAIEGADDDIVTAVFDLHPDREEKTAGRAISHYEVRTYKFGTRAFFVVFTDGTSIDFSFEKALRHAYPATSKSAAFA
jgi:hypothetical protein